MAARKSTNRRLARKRLSDGWVAVAPARARMRQAQRTTDTNPDSWRFRSQRQRESGTRVRGIDRGPECHQGTNRAESGRLGCLLLCNVFCLRALLALDDFKLNVIALLQALITFRLDGAVVDEHVRAVVPANKAEALRVVKPFHFAFDSRHVPYSELSWKTQCRSAWTGIFLIGFSFCLRKDAGRRRLPSPGLCVVNHNFGFAAIFPRF